MPTIRFQPTFMSQEPISIQVEPGTTIQQAAWDADVPIGDACGGNCACSTCHVHVIQGAPSLTEMEDDEDDILGKAQDVRAESRLACQARCGRVDLVVKITRESQLAFMNEHPEHRGRAGDVVA